MIEAHPDLAEKLATDPQRYHTEVSAMRVDYGLEEGTPLFPVDYVKETVNRVKALPAQRQMIELRDLGSTLGSGFSDFLTQAAGQEGATHMAWAALSGNEQILEAGQIAPEVKSALGERYSEVKAAAAAKLADYYASSAHDNSPEKWAATEVTANYAAMLVQAGRGVDEAVEIAYRSTGGQYSYARRMRIHNSFSDVQPILDAAHMVSVHSSAIARAVAPWNAEGLDAQEEFESTDIYMVRGSGNSVILMAEGPTGKMMPVLGSRGKILEFDLDQIVRDNFGVPDRRTMRMRGGR